MLVLVESEIEVTNPPPSLDFAALTAACEAFADVGARLVETFRPMIWQFKLLCDLLFGHVPVEHRAHTVTMVAALAGLWSHSVWVCPEFECGSRMRHDVDHEALVCVNGHSFDADRLSALAGLPLS